MLRINLLTAHHEIRKEKKRGWLFQGFSLAVLIIIAGVILGYWLLGNQIKSLKREKAALEQQTQNSATLQKEIAELKEKKDFSRNRLSLLQNLEKERHGPVQLMESLANVIPLNQLWLTSLKETGTEIKIDGISLSNETLADFMKRLEMIPLFKQVDLVNSTQAVYKDLTVKNFSLIAWTQPPPAPAEPGEKKK